MDNLRAKALIRNDILVLEGIDIINSRSIAVINSCGVQIPITIETAKGPIIDGAKVLAKLEVRIPANTRQAILVTIKRY